MTTPPPTADRAAPSWLPDEATLSRLAGEFFRAVPGQPVMPPAAAPIAPPVAPPATPASAAPVAAPSTPPATPRATLPFAPVRPAAARLPLAPSPTAAAPAAPTSPAAPGTGTYYFLTESGPPAGSPVLPAAPSTPYYFVHERPRQPSGASAPSGPSVAPDPHPPFDVLAVRRDFPILSERVNGRPLIWLDNAATTQKPRAVIDRLVDFYSHENSNIHRAAHELAARATDAYEHARRTVARFLGAGSAEEIVFVRGTTEAINLVANAWGNGHVRAGDEIVISHLEHHANIVPWQLLAERTGAVIKVIPVDESGQVLLEEYAALLSARTKLVAVTQVSNALGTVVPVKQVIELGHRAGARVLIDAAQSAPHMPTDVSLLDADFLAFSGHKLFGPTGIGVLYGKREALEEMAPWEGGGNMIVDVTLERSVFQPPPGRFEAGTGNIADAVGLAAAIEYVERIGLPGIAAYEHTLVEHATEGLRHIPGLRLIGTAPEKAGIVSFVLDGHQPAEVGSALNRHGIAVRAGHHCAQPILRRFGLEATVRPSFAFYNTHDEVDALIAAVRQLSAGGRRS